jgi:hypothetical protein
MLPIPKLPLTHRQKAVALRVAGLADFVQILLIPALIPGYVADDVIDLIVAIILSAVCGFKWQFLAAFLIELIPGLGLLPTWSAVVLTIPSVPDGTYWAQEGLDPNQRVTASDPYAAEGQYPSGRRPASHPPIRVSAVAVPPVQAPPMGSNH